MTRNEFAKRLAISMAANPEYASGAELDFDSIIHDADTLTKKWEEMSDYGYFDDESGESNESLKTSIDNISGNIFELKEAFAHDYDSDVDPSIAELLSHLRDYMQGERGDTGKSTLQEIAVCLHEIMEHIQFWAKTGIPVSVGD